MSARAIVAEASVRLEASRTASNSVARDIALRRAALDIERVEVMNRLSVELPAAFVDVLIYQRKYGPLPTPLVVAVCPTISREEFIRTLPENHPARIAQKKEQQK